MARPAKSVELQSSHLTKQEITVRKNTENMLRGSTAVRPPYHLTKAQKKIFRAILQAFLKADIAGELDAYILAEGAVVIDRLQQIEQKINDQPELLLDKDVMSIRKGYTQDFFRICNELSLSPQSRAKLGSIAAGKVRRNSDPLLRLLEGEKK